MKIKINVNGDIHLPKIIKENLGIRNGEELNIECKNEKIIITKNNKLKSAEEIQSFLSDLTEFNDDISRGMKTMAEWVLGKDEVEREDV